MPLPAGRMLSHAELAQQQGVMRPGAAVPGESAALVIAAAWDCPHVCKCACSRATAQGVDPEQQLQPSGVYKHPLNVLLLFPMEPSPAYCQDCTARA